METTNITINSIRKGTNEMKTRTFKAEVEGKEVEFLVKSPSMQNQKEATKVYNTAFSDALKSKAIVRAKLDDLLVEQGLWDDAKQMKFATLQAQILEGERKLAKGGISLREAKEEALKMKKLREDLRELISVKTSLDTHTAEGQADNARFNYLVSACTVYKDNERPYFNSYEDYNSRSGDVVAVLAAQNLAGMLYGLDSDYEEKLPENKFLKQYKFVDSELRLIDKQGRLIDKEGRLIDENGRFINEKGEYIDKNGNLVDKDGEYVVEFSPFLDDDGKPVESNVSESANVEDTDKVETAEKPTSEPVAVVEEEKK
jgi:hypothetical protein